MNFHAVREWFSNFIPFDHHLWMCCVDENIETIPGSVCVEQIVYETPEKIVIGRWTASMADVGALWKPSSLHGDIQDLFLEVSNRVFNHCRSEFLKYNHLEPQLNSRLPRFVINESVLEGSLKKVSVRMVLESEFKTVETLLDLYECDNRQTPEQSSDSCAPISLLFLNNNVSTFIDSLPLGVIVLDFQCRIKGWNRWMIDHATGSFSSGLKSRNGHEIFLFSDECLPESNTGYALVKTVIKKVLTDKQPIFLSHVFHKNIFPLVNRNKQNMYQNVHILPTSDGCLIQIEDMTNLVERDILLQQQSEWLSENINKNDSRETEESDTWRNDSLTGLPNRIGWSQQFRMDLTKSETETNFTLVCFGIDRLKIINDSLGFLMGDRLIQEVSTRLRLSYPRSLIGRWDGDTFFVLNKNDPFITIPIILTQPYNFGTDDDFIVTFSVGVMDFTSETCNEPHKAIQSVEWALQDAKQKGRNRICHYEGEDEHRSRVFQIETGLRNALERKQMYILFQPQVSFKSRRVIGTEVLLRWNHPTLGLISPDVFIPIAEDSGIIGELTFWVFETACRKKMEIKEKFPDWQFTMSVNISVAQFRDPDLIKNIDRVIKATGVDPSELVMEITEGIILHGNPHNMSILDAIRNLGMGLSIDDFGNGYSSLSYLNQFNVNQIKLDKAFLLDSQNERLLGSLIRMSHDLNLEVVTEGVETAFHDRILTEQNCDIGQGFFFGRPITDVEFIKFKDVVFPFSVSDS